ncbi:hypothetical protein SAMN05444371_1877 [Epilithonimonas mollis]|uniref:Uncharacterized protein n=1 Tax=Epilithonimonas mollis TaxID=216903 RepID=A0A1M6RFV9_9FLAO|nr:hypothetical protein SAMN05444371_1877 [Epilithonimonas mollis]
MVADILFVFPEKQKDRSGRSDPGCWNSEARDTPKYKNKS